MKQGKKISDLIHHKSPTKDYAELNHIFKLYLNNHYDKMCRAIYFYKDFEFFRDILVYLDNNFRRELLKDFFYRDLTEIYYDNYDTMWGQLKIKKIFREFWQNLKK